MKYTISSLSFDWGKVRHLEGMPLELGFEIFWECGSEDSWHHTMDILQANGKRRLSIHSPYLFNDLSLPGDTAKKFEELRRPFEFYHRYDAEFYVVHTCDHLYGPSDPQTEEDRRKRAMDRLGAFNEICRAEGVLMVAENIAYGKGERPLFNHDQYLELFRQLPQLHCLIDLGHAALADIRVSEIQKELRERIVAYHLHDNDGTADSHKRMWMGTRDWDAFARGVAKYTPEAIGVMEYYGFPDLANYLEDSARLEKLICSSLRVES